MPSHIHISIENHKNCTGHISNVDIEQNYCPICSLNLNSIILSASNTAININSFDYKYIPFKEKIKFDLFENSSLARAPPV